jgi:phosphate transport system substrate-binding protein
VAGKHGLWNALRFNHWTREIHLMKKILTVAAILALVAHAEAAQARDQIRIVGSSTVYPFATTVAETFGKAGKFKTPVVESTGTGGGLRLFCAGEGPDTPDIADASRRIEPSEVETCAKNGVTGIAEIRIGFDGITFANAKKGPDFKLTRDQIYRAIAKEVPVDGKLVPNPYKMWSDIDPSLPKTDIVVYGPAPNHGTRDALVELVMDPACVKQPEIKALGKDAQKQACQSVREDGAWVEVSESYNVTMQKLSSNPGAIGIVGFSYLDQNQDKAKAALIDGVPATFDNISTAKYPVSRPLFFYVKKAHVGLIPGIKEYIAEFTSDKAWGPNGYLADKGLIPMGDAERKAEAAHAATLADLKL